MSRHITKRRGRDSNPRRRKTPRNGFRVRRTHEKTPVFVEVFDTRVIRGVGNGVASDPAPTGPAATGERVFWQVPRPGPAGPQAPLQRPVIACGAVLLFPRCESHGNGVRQAARSGPRHADGGERLAMAREVTARKWGCPGR